MGRRVRGTFGSRSGVRVGPPVTGNESRHHGAREVSGSPLFAFPASSRLPRSASPPPPTAACLRLVKPSDVRYRLRAMAPNLSRRYRQLTGGLDVLARYLLTPFARPNEEAVIVLGNSKSGTTAITALLADYADASVTLDFWPRLRDPETLAALHSGEEPFEAFVRRFRADFSRDIVKDPHLTFLYPPLAERFPDARFLMIVRDPRDNIRSILDRLDLPGDRDDLDLARYEMRPLWRAILESPWLEVDGDGYVERLAQRWSLAASVYLRRPDAMELVRYEDFVDDKMGTIADLAERLGLEHRGRIEHKLDRRYQPKGRSDVVWEEFFGPRNLRLIEETCVEEARALGYEVS